MKKNNKTKSVCPTSVKHLLVDPLSHLTGSVNSTSSQYLFHAKCDNGSIRIKLGEQSFSSEADEMHTLYMKFDAQPIICRMVVNQSSFIQKHKCIVKAEYTIESTSAILSSESPSSAPTSVYDMTSSSTIETTLLSSILITTAEIGTTMHATYVNTNETTMTSTKQTTNSIEIDDLTTLITISTARPIASFTEFDTTVLLTGNSTSSRITSTIRDILMSSDIVSTPMYSSEVLVSTTTDISNITFGIKSTTHMMTNTTSKKPAINTKTSKKISKTSTTSIVPLGKLPSNKKSSPHIQYVIIILSIIGVMALIACLGFFYLHHQTNGTESFLDRNDSDESLSSVSTKSDQNPSSAYDEEKPLTDIISQVPLPLKQEGQSKIFNKKSPGRIFSQIDPDGL
ncbi:unnamed protein product [Rotaria socialis]|uniref:Uncharacterized protein n=2 Tax=Rotaria socialis TaxID=392032 RepID=A0A819VK02_9BILA|nr:unnamed protein product [Rotaria socialis]